MSDDFDLDPDAFEGTVVDDGDPLVLDDGVDTVTVDAGPTAADPVIGERVRAVGALDDGTLHHATVEYTDRHASLDELANAVADAGLLTVRQAEVYILRHVEGVSRKEAARTMGLSPNTVDKHLSRARQRVETARDTLRAINRASDLLDHQPAKDGGDE